MHTKQVVSAIALALLLASAPAAFAMKPVKSSKAGWTAAERAQFEQAFTMYDRNGDGLITRAEFPADATLFDRLDLNRDGAITRAEVERAVPNRAALERQIRNYDRNGDGVITRDEFPGNDTAFNRLDRNHDGVLTQADRRGRKK